MKLNVFDHYQIIQDTEEHPFDMGLLEKLDEMLNIYGVAHAFTIPHQETLDEKPDACIEVDYCEDDHMTFSLVYALFCKTCRKITDRKLAGALERVAAHYSEI